MHMQASVSSNEIVAIHDEEESSSTNNPVELWLDLRQSSIPPQTALLHLANDIWDEYTPPDNKSLIVDKILVPLTDGRNMNMDQIVRDIREEFEDEVGILSISNKIGIDNDSDNENDIDDPQLYLSEVKDDNILIPFGKVINVKDESGNGMINVNVNPMPVLETVSRGEWVVLDVDENVDPASISSLVELVSTATSSSSAGFGLLENGLVGDVTGTANDSSEEEDPSTCRVGGMAFRCDTQASVVEMGALIQSFSGNNKGYQTTASGILVQSTSDDESENESRTNDASMRFAIVMPFDALLWKTSSFVYSASDIP